MEKDPITVRVSDSLYAGSGNTALQINVLGAIETGQEHGFADPLASNGRMRRLQSGNETLPNARAHRLNTLADFVTVRPWLVSNTLRDTDNGIATGAMANM